VVQHGTRCPKRIKRNKEIVDVSAFSDGVSPRGVASLVGVKEKRIRDQFLIKEIREIKNGN
jgi:hypothetical protein